MANGKNLNVVMMNCIPDYDHREMKMFFVQQHMEQYACVITTVDATSSCVVCSDQSSDEGELVSAV
jgi:hypothetical protein